MPDAILFDLDNTLYSESCGVFDLIDQRMNKWLISNLQIPESEVNDFRNKYFVQYGTTLRGLMLHHEVNPRDFLDYVHDVPVHEFLSADLELRETLEQVTARKLIFTNSDLKHANRILDALGVRDQFERIFDIEAMNFIPKPNPDPYRIVLGYLKMEAKNVLLIDDMERNLKPAREMGMQTILIGNGKPVDDRHHAIENIKELTKILEQITK
ncbi:MAG TPA: pyrimidine 5'-nucleotidase [Acidobacteriota bacterium]|jgi:putative hydrolase of the HAD superfamily